MAAIVHIGRLELSGLPVWWFRLAARVFFLIGFRDRFVVLLNWALAYWSYQRARHASASAAPAKRCR